LRPEVLGRQLVTAMEAVEADLEHALHDELRIEAHEPRGGRWPIDSMDDDTMLWRALDRDDFDAVWVRCAEDVCVGGDVHNVRIYRFDFDRSRWWPEYEFAMVDDDPAGQLFRRGVSEERISGLLDP